MLNTIYSGQNKNQITRYCVLLKLFHTIKWLSIRLEKGMVLL